MFHVIERETGKRLPVYNVNGNQFLVGEDDGFEIRPIDDFIPLRQGDNIASEEAAYCVFSAISRNEDNLDSLLADISSGAVPVELGDTISIRLLDGTEVDLVVTDQDDKTVRLESRDCLGVNTSANDLPEYLEKVYGLLPAALKDRIMRVERVHVDGEGEKYTDCCKLFVPAASEIFPPDECYGDKGLYEQLDWYKDVHNRVRADRKGGSSHWYWTSSAYSSTTFCTVYISGTAATGHASNAYGVAPFGCILPKT